MLKYYDFECEKCGFCKEEFTEDVNKVKCEKCGNKMIRIFTSFNFKLVYDNKKDMCGWGDNNYDSSQYWSKVKEMREQGHDVKGCNED